MNNNNSNNNNDSKKINTNNTDNNNCNNQYWFKKSLMKSCIYMEMIISIINIANAIKKSFEGIVIY